MGGGLKGRLEWGFQPVTAALIIGVVYVADITVILQFAAHQDAIERAVRGALGYVGWIIVGWGLAIPLTAFLIPFLGPPLLYILLTKGRSGI